MEPINIAVFGSSGAIGKALCIEFSKNKKLNKIFAFSRNGDQLNHQSIISKQVDYLNEDSLAETAQSLKCKLDIIVVAIGALEQPEKSIRDLSSDKFIDMFVANTIPTALIAKYFLPYLHRDRITKFASISARVGSIEDNELGGWYSYRASKSALNMIIKNFAIEINRTNKNSIIFGLHPGTVTSKLSDSFKNKKNNYFSPETSANYLYNVIETKAKDDNGKIFDWNNQEILP